ncbi:MAG: tRNA epoxyqueuosine(34) reductase QueG, partial [Myxococcales bacterium]|nr:tRNA epoxyqueuosine(34) reductase QueG [Myxococcales bacterium]
MSSSPAANPAENQQPWVTYGLLVLCAIALMYSNRLERDVRSSADVAVEKAAAYWTERPYLEPAESIAKKLTAEAIQSRRAEFQRDRSGRGSIGVPRAVRSHYQEILDGLTAEALEPLLQLPRYRMGVRVSKPDGVSYFTHAFLHGGWLHLIGNGILLLILGCYIERVWGHFLFSLSLLVFSLAAATAFRIGNPELDASLIGTSGMIAGLLAAFMLRFASRWTEAGYCTVIIGGLCWLTLSAGFGWDGSVVLGPSASSEMTGLANASFWALAGGFGCGLVITAMMMFGKIEAILFNTEPRSAKRPSMEPDLEAALGAHADGRSDEAFELISALLQRNPEYRAALLAMWEVALDVGRDSDASLAMLQVIRDEVRRNVPSAVDHWLDLKSRGLHGDMAWMADTQARRAAPKALWPEAQSIVVLGTNYGPRGDPLASLARRDRGTVSVYARGVDYHRVLKRRLKRLGRWMAETLDCEVKVFVDTAPVMEKPLAARAGVGWQGKHTNLISRDFGSWLFLGEVFTTLTLPADAPETDHCGSCDLCQRACPTGALAEAYRIDPGLCISYLTIEHKGPIAPGLSERMGNRIYGCDDCLAVCPWNKFAAPTPDEAFAASAETDSPRLADLARLDDA